MRGLVSAVFGVLAMQAVGVVADAPTFNGCVGGCGDTTRSNPDKNFFGCANADDLGCLCKKDDFLFGVRDCSKGCNAPMDMIENWVKSGPCAPFNAVLPGDKPAPTSTQAQPTTSSSTPPPPPPPTTSSSSVSVASTPAATQSSSTTSASATEVSTEAASSTATEASASASSTAPASESTSAAAAAGGLSYASTVGIGVGVAAAVVAAGIVGFILLKNRKRKPAPRQSMDISKPMPGSGRTYPDRERVRDSFEKYAADIEMTSNRYEDMVPRTQPRTMV